MFGLGKIKKSLVARLLLQVLGVLLVLAAVSSFLFWYGTLEWNKRLYARYNRSVLSRFRSVWRSELAELVTSLFSRYDLEYSWIMSRAGTTERADAEIRRWLKARLEASRFFVDELLAFYPDGSLDVAYRPRMEYYHLVFATEPRLSGPLDRVARQVVRGGKFSSYELRGWFPMMGDFKYWLFLQYYTAGDTNAPSARVFALLLSLRETMRHVMGSLGLRAPQGIAIVRKDGVVLYCEDDRWVNQHASRVFENWRDLGTSHECLLRTRSGERWLIASGDLFGGPNGATVLVYTDMSAFEVGFVRKILLGHLAVTVVAFAATVLLVTLRTRNALKTLGDLSQQAEQIARGRWGGQVQVTGEDEVGRLAMSFNRMSRSLAHLVEQVAWERSERREHQKISEMRATLLQVLGHDLNKLLTAIKSPLENLMAGTYGECPSRARRPLRRAIVAVRLMEDMVLNILATARIERGQVRLELSRFREREIMTELQAFAEALEERWSRKDITIRFEDGAAEIPLIADREKLVRVLVNLVANAVESVRRSKRQDGVVVVRSVSSGFDVLFEVADNGEGMDREQVAQWLRDEGRLAGKDSAGLGLGLSIVKTFVQLHGGRIQVETQRGAGTTFRICIPRIARQQKGEAEGRRQEN